VTTIDVSKVHTAGAGVTPGRMWLPYAILTTVLWGVWGALIEIPERAGFPATLGYVAWAFTMVPVAFIALRIAGWQLDRDRHSIVLGMAAGLMGCGGQLILFQCLRMGPAYIVFPIVSLYPVVTIILAVVHLKEKAPRRAWFGICLALVAIALLAYQPPEARETQGVLWLVLAIMVFLLWGGQAYIMKLASDRAHGTDMRAESVAFYLMASAILLIPVAVLMTDGNVPINWGLGGVYAALLIQALNAVGFLFFAYAIQHGKAIVVVPLMSLAPVVTVVLSLLIYAVVPHVVIVCGIVLALVAIYLISQ
jgi:drug/metabolite transporter (DMT)-like permease